MSDAQPLCLLYNLGTSVVPQSYCIRSQVMAAKLVSGFIILEAQSVFQSDKKYNSRSEED